MGRCPVSPVVVSGGGRCGVWSSSCMVAGVVCVGVGVVFGGEGVCVCVCGGGGPEGPAGA